MSTGAKCGVVIAAIVLGATAMTSHAQERPRIMPPPHPDIAPTYADQVYRMSGELELRADVYLPESREPTSAIAWFAPGGFRVRDKRWIRGSVFEQLNRGFAIVSFEYTLATEAKWPAQAHDGKAAIRWLRDNAKGFNIDPEGIFIGGGSAGALIASVVANSVGDASLAEPGAEDASVPDRVRGVVTFYGPTDLTTTVGWPEDRSIVAFLTGCESGDCGSVAGSASPVSYVSEDSPPALMFYGMGDVVVGYEQGLLLQERLNDAGVDAQLVLRSDLIHGDPRFDEPAMSDLITAFLRKSL